MPLDATDIVCHYCPKVQESSYPISNPDNLVNTHSCKVIPTFLTIPPSRSIAHFKPIITLHSYFIVKESCCNRDRAIPSILQPKLSKKPEFIDLSTLSGEHIQFSGDPINSHIVTLDTLERLPRKRGHIRHFLHEYKPTQF